MSTGVGSVVAELLDRAALAGSFVLGPPLRGGRNNRVLPVVVGTDRYCVKIYAADRIDRSGREIEALEALAGSSVRRPVLLAATQDRSAVLLSWVDGGAIPAERWTVDHARRLVDALRTVHGTVMPEVFPTALWPPLQMVDRITGLLPADARGIWRAAVDRLGDLAPTAEPVLGRGDPALSNVLFTDDDDIGFVDFENAGVSDASWEFADVLEHPQSQGFDTVVVDELLHAFAADGDIERVMRYRQVMRVFWAARRGTPDPGSVIRRITG